jgi:hypothetical protein
MRRHDIGAIISLGFWLAWKWRAGPTNDELSLAVKSVPGGNSEFRQALQTDRRAFLSFTLGF